MGSVFWLASVLLFPVKSSLGSRHPALARVLWLVPTRSEVTRSRGGDASPFSTDSKEYQEFPCREVTCLRKEKSLSLLSHTEQSYALKNVTPGWVLPSASLNSKRWSSGISDQVSCLQKLLPLLPPASLFSSKKKMILKSKTINWVPFHGRLRLPLFFFYLFSITEIYWKSFLPIHSSLSFPTPVNGSGGLNHLRQFGHQTLTFSTRPSTGVLIIFLQSIRFPLTSATIFFLWGFLPQDNMKDEWYLL